LKLLQEYLKFNLIKSKKMRKIAINGMGRIGRATQSNIGHTKFELVAVNDIVSAENIAYLIKYDSVYGVYEKEVTFDDKTLL
jgi:glyceraldehyde 3-phosphate dehydrogenase